MSFKNASAYSGPIISFNGVWPKFPSTVIDHNCLEHLPTMWLPEEPCHQKLHHLILNEFELWW
jgi:hypothetical protein